MVRAEHDSERMPGKNGKSSRPEIVFLGVGGKEDRVGRLSISHDGEYVVATVLASG
jgi:holo-[acyl-carrier protein] synthase